MKVIVGKSLVEEEDANVSVRDAGFLYGDGVFETLRVYHGVPFALEAHLSRLSRGLAHLGIRGLTTAGLATLAMRFIEANAMKEGKMRITVSRGGTEGPLSSKPRRQPTVVIDGGPLPKMAVRPAAAVVNIERPTQRVGPQDFKPLSSLTAVLAEREAAAAGAKVAILLGSAGAVAEAATANVFWVIDGTLFTPAPVTGILPGITRAIVLDLAAQLGIPVREVQHAPAALLDAQEVFLTSSLREVFPLGAVLYAGERRQYGPGRMTETIAAAYRGKVDASR